MCLGKYVTNQKMVKKNCSLGFDYMTCISSRDKCFKELSLVKDVVIIIYDYYIQQHQMNAIYNLDAFVMYRLANVLFIVWNAINNVIMVIMKYDTIQHACQPCATSQDGISMECASQSFHTPHCEKCDVHLRLKDKV